VSLELTYRSPYDMDDSDEKGSDEIGAGNGSDEYGANDETDFQINVEDDYGRNERGRRREDGGQQI
jgi:hypothetical protein